ncbi:MAG: Nif3-like dinuclear metal center hexameric protein [Spirochaetia bacterium]|nr:Nif3-like dinuclear metal center hexameric protein [Spirochaetia bacterium]
MIQRIKLETYLNKILEIEKFQDYTVNGIQIEGSSEINKIITCVSISQNIIEQAVYKKANAIIAHHGFFWKNDPPQITGIFKNKLNLLFKNNINLFAYHLPLDASIKWGNNFPILKKLRAVPKENISNIGYTGILKHPVTYEEFFNTIGKIYKTKGVHIKPQNKKIVKKVGVIAGRAVDFFRESILLNIDAFVTGEGTEWIYSMALENEISFSAMGHNKSEEIGIKLLSEHLQKKFKINTEFIAEDNPF